eukprot:6196283-Pleurochrysis_carterae.AAC.6
MSTTGADLGDGIDAGTVLAKREVDLTNLLRAPLLNCSAVAEATGVASAAIASLTCGSDGDGGGGGGVTTTLLRQSQLETDESENQPHSSSHSLDGNLPFVDCAAFDAHIGNLTSEIMQLLHSDPISGWLARRLLQKEKVKPDECACFCGFTGDAAVACKKPWRDLAPYCANYTAPFDPLAHHADMAAWPPANAVASCLLFEGYGYSYPVGPTAVTATAAAEAMAAMAALGAVARVAAVLDGTKVPGSSLVYWRGGASCPELRPASFGCTLSEDGRSFAS